MIKPNLYFVNGGLGRQIAFTSIIEGLFEKTKNKICISSGYPSVFQNHPKIAKQILYHNFFLSENAQYYYKKYSKIFSADPYCTDFLKGDKHLIDSFAELYGVKNYKKEPDLYIDENLEKQLKKDVLQLNKFIIVQFYGADFNSGRDYTYGQEVVNFLRKKYPFLNILNMRNPDQPKILGCINMPNETYESFMVYAKYCLTFLSIDSSLMHMCSNRHFNKKGLCLWGSTSSKMFGYEKNVNLYSNYPDSCEIEPKLILEKMEEILDEL